MYNHHFINVKSMAGELIFSQKRQQLACTLTTKEVIFQQPHATYHILLEDIIGIAPFQLKKARNHIGVIGETQLITQFPQEYYKLSANKAVVIKPSGVYERHQAHVIVPLNRRFIDQLIKHGRFNVVFK